jgi:hypothetical protein
MSLDLLAMVDGDEVRGALDLGLKASALPDSKIDRAVFTRPARRALLALYADAEDEEEGTEGGDSVITAFNLLVAAQILPSLPQLTAQKAGEDGYSRRFDVSVAERVAQLEAAALAELIDLVAEETLAVPTIFGLAHGTRGL